MPSLWHWSMTQAMGPLASSFCGTADAQPHLTVAAIHTALFMNSFYCLAQFTDLLLLESSWKELSFEDNLIFGQWIQRRKHSIAQKRKSIPPSILHHPLTSSPCLEVLGPWGMFTWTFFSSFLGLNKQLRSYLKPKKLLKKLHVNVPQDWGLKGQDWGH